MHESSLFTSKPSFFFSINGLEVKGSSVHHLLSQHFLSFLRNWSAVISWSLAVRFLSFLISCDLDPRFFYLHLPILSFFTSYSFSYFLDISFSFLTCELLYAQPRRQLTASKLMIVGRLTPGWHNNNSIQWCLRPLSELLFFDSFFSYNPAAVFTFQK